MIWCFSRPGGHDVNSTIVHSVSIELLHHSTAYYSVYCSSSWFLSVLGMYIARKMDGASKSRWTATAGSVVFTNIVISSDRCHSKICWMPPSWSSKLSSCDGTTAMRPSTASRRRRPVSCRRSGTKPTPWPATPTLNLSTRIKWRLKVKRRDQCSFFKQRESPNIGFQLGL